MTSITIFERLPKLCKKILVTGNGRCNFSNTDLSLSHFYGDYTFLKTILTSVYSDSENYFRSIGILPYYEDGRIYPRSQQSSSIRDALLNPEKAFCPDKRLEATLPPTADPAIPRTPLN